MRDYGNLGNAHHACKEKPWLCYHNEDAQSGWKLNQQEEFEMEKKQDSSRVDEEITNFRKEQLIPRVTCDREVGARRTITADWIW